MNVRAQFEYHPDADQIGAFVEQALPEHEREQMLDHLAVCAECRAIVALSLPEVEAPAIELPKPARRRWWAGWAVAWPVAGAVAALAFLIFYTRNAPIAPNVSPQSQDAVAQTPAAPSSQEQALASPAQPALRSSQMQSKDKSSATATGAAGIATKSRARAANPAYAVDEAILTGRDAAELIKVAPPSSQAGNALNSNGPSAATGNLVSNSANNAMAGLSSGASGNAEDGLQLKAPTPTLKTAIRPAQMAPAAVPQPANPSTVSVVAANEAQMETVPADAASAEIAQEEVGTAPLKHPLPSRLAVLSMAVQGRSMLAIDMRSAVFLSNDAGKHWKAIHAPWQGHAVKAVLVGPQAGSAANMRLASAGAFQSYNKTPPTASIGSLVAQSPAPSGSGSSISGTLTDPTGAVIAGANVVVTEIATGTAHTVQTDGAGRYLVDGLAPGTYRVEARAYSFNPQSLAAVAVAPNRQTFANLSLTIAASTQTVMVTGADVMEGTDAKRKAARSTAPMVPRPIFEITTDSGERWTSADGVNWKRM